MGAIMNIFRVPLNVLVVVGTKMESHFPHSTCFMYCAAWHAVTTVASIALVRVADKAAPVEKRGKKASKKGSKTE